MTHDQFKTHLDAAISAMDEGEREALIAARDRAEASEDGTWEKAVADGAFIQKLVDVARGSLA